MFALDPAVQPRVDQNFADLASKGVLAVDMETSALLTVGASLNCRVSSLCVASVDSKTREKLNSEDMREAERKLAMIAFDSLKSIAADDSINS